MDDEEQVEISPPVDVETPKNVVVVSSTTVAVKENAPPESAVVVPTLVLQLESVNISILAPGRLVPDKTGELSFPVLPGLTLVNVGSNSCRNEDAESRSPSGFPLHEESKSVIAISRTLK